MSKRGPYYDKGMWKGAPSKNFERASMLREQMTEAELKLWNELKDGRLMGLKFRRQHPLHLFIADFYCHKLKLVIEVDGAYHNEAIQRENDKKREELIRFQDLKVIRFKNEQVLFEVDKVIEEIKKLIASDFPTL